MKNRFGAFFASTTADTWACLLLASVCAARIVYCAFLGLVPDEAYYWDWSRSLSFGYFDHPPMIAWLIFFSRFFFGDTLLGVRFAILILSVAAIGASYLLTRQYAVKPSSRILFIVLSNSVILFGVGSLLATPDIPLVFFWSLGLFFAYQAVFKSKTTFWFLLGIVGGLGLLSKYTFVLFFVSFVLFLCISNEQRKWLARWQPYCSMAMALLVFLPNLLWNSRHGWISVLFQASHGIGGRFQLDSLGEFIGGQIGVLSLFPFVLLAIALGHAMKRLSDSRILFLAVFFLVPFTLFLMSSAQKKVEANWAAPAYVSGLICISVLWENLDKNRNRLLRRFTVFSAGFAIVTTIAILWHLQRPFLPLAPANDPATQLRGWKQWSMEIDSVRRLVDPARALPLAVNRYQEAALLAFYLPDHPETIALNIGARDNQYSLLQRTKPTGAKTVLFIHQTDDPAIRPYLAAVFSSLLLSGQVMLRQEKSSTQPFGVFTGIVKASL
jgi:4-amino-4-deoxy-L-arabinose transferase-like glycosyltransferase